MGFPISHTVLLDHLPPELTPLVLAQVVESHWKLPTEIVMDFGHRLYVIYTDDAPQLARLVLHCELCRQVALVLFAPDPPHCM